MMKKMLNRTVMIKQEVIRKLGRAAYAACILIFFIIYGLFYLFFQSKSEEIMKDLGNFTLSGNVKILIGFFVLCLFSLAFLFTMTIWRGNDIGLPKWQSAFLFLLPVVPQLLFTMLGFDTTGVWMDIVAFILWMIALGILCWLPSNWGKKNNLFFR